MPGAAGGKRTVAASLLIQDGSIGAPALLRAQKAWITDPKHGACGGNPREPMRARRPRCAYRRARARRYWNARAISRFGELLAPTANKLAATVAKICMHSGKKRQAFASA